MLTRRLGLPAWGMLAALWFWIYSGQSAVARETVFAGAEHKAVAYGLVFLGLRALVGGDSGRSGAMFGGATVFHVLVGGWTGLAALLTLLTTSTTKRRALFSFSGYFLSLALPAVIFAAVTYMPEAVARETTNVDSAAAAREYVLFVAPFHLDPGTFWSWRSAVAAGFTAFFTIWLISVSMPAASRKVLVAFLTVLLAIFCVGLLAWQLEWYWFLKYYPFRTADVLLPLFFWLSIAAFVSAVRTNPSTGVGLLRSAGACFALALLVALLARRSTQALHRFDVALSDSFTEWSAFANTPGDGFDEAARWIRESTPRDSVFAADPCERRFYMLAQRPQVVSYKLVPGIQKVAEWHARLRDMNGGSEFAGRGSAICDVLPAKFLRLTRGDLSRLRTAYGARYYLGSSERRDLTDLLEHEVGKFAIYRMPDAR
jgi:hypothetical protein